MAAPKGGKKVMRRRRDAAKSFVIIGCWIY